MGDMYFHIQKKKQIKLNLNSCLVTVVYKIDGLVSLGNISSLFFKLLQTVPKNILGFLLDGYYLIN